MSICTTEIVEATAYPDHLPIVLINACMGQYVHGDWVMTGWHHRRCWHANCDRYFEVTASYRRGVEALGKARAADRLELIKLGLVPAQWPGEGATREGGGR